MNHRLRAALIGDRSDDVPAHRAIPLALAGAAAALGTDVEAVWVPTDRIVSGEMLATFDAVWCVPASPYRSMAGALRAIRWARENPIEVGLEGRDKIEVTWGLKEGDAVITRGFEVLQDKSPLSVIFPDDPVASASDKLATTTGENNSTTITLSTPGGT